MTYLQKNKRGRLTKKISLIVIALILSLLFFFGGEIKNLIQTINVPISFGKNLIVNPISEFFNYFNSKKILDDENQSLKKDNKRMRLENLTLETLKKENIELKELLNYQTKENPKNTAKILNKTPFSPFDTFVIDLGKEQTQIGKKAYYQNILIGEIEEIYDKTSVVRLYSSPEKILSVKIAEIETEAKGSSAGTFKIEIPKDVEIKKGDIMSSLEDEVIAIVNEIELNQSSTFKNIHLSFPVSINSINWVLIGN